MTKVQLPKKWLDKSFDFGKQSYSPLEFLLLLEEAPKKLESYCKGFSEGDLSRRFNDAWSVKENIGHLADLESLWLGRSEDFFNSKEILRPADMSNKKSKEAEHNSKPIKAVLNEFKTGRASFVSFCYANITKLENKVAYHERLHSNMSFNDMLYFIEEHDRHHGETVLYLLEHI